MMDKKSVSRREFVQGGLALGSVAGVLLLTGVGCDSSKPAAQGSGAGSAPQPVAAGCNDVSALSDADKQTREQLKYVDASVIAAKNCDNCQLFVAAEAGKPCGGCKVVKGPINAKGYCTAWAAKA